MKWVIRARPKTDRIACPWLIRRFLDPDAEILYVPAEQVLSVAEAEGTHSFDALDADYGHRDGKCTFEVLIEDHGLGGDPALARLARIACSAPRWCTRARPRRSMNLASVTALRHALEQYSRARRTGQIA